MQLTPAEKEWYFAMNPNRCILYRQVHCEVITQDSPSPSRSNGGQVDMGPYMVTFESYLDQGCQGDEQLKELIANRTTVSLARPMNVEMCGSPKSMLDVLDEADFEFISAVIESTGDWPTLTRRLANIKKYGIISPTRQERAATRRKIDDSFVNPDEVRDCYEPLPKRAKQEINDTDADRLLNQLDLESREGNSVLGIFEGEDETTPVKAQDSTTIAPSDAVGVHQLPFRDDQDPPENHTFEMGDSFETVTIENEHLRRSSSALTRELAKVRRQNVAQEALIQTIREERLQQVQSQQQTLPPVQVQMAPQQQQNVVQQQQQNSVQQQQRNMVQRRVPASPPVVVGAFRSHVRKAYYPLPTGDYVLDPRVVRHCPFENIEVFTRYMLVNVFGREGLKNHSLYGGSVPTNPTPPKPALDTHKLNAILNLCCEKFGPDDANFEGNFGKAGRNRLPKNRKRKIAATGAVVG